MPGRPVVILTTDGSCFGNPGPGGWAAILSAPGGERVLTGSDPETTNNRMELMAVVQGLTALKVPCTVTLTSDSQLVVKGLTAWLPGWLARGGRRADGHPVEHWDLWQQLHALVQRHIVEAVWVRGHAGHPLNTRADALAQAAARAAHPYTFQCACGYTQPLRTMDDDPTTSTGCCPICGGRAWRIAERSATGTWLAVE
jgi:ribonuclease HI